MSKEKLRELAAMALMLTMFIGIAVIIAALSLFMVGCAMSQPYVTVQSVGVTNEVAWFSDGPTLAITVHNPTDREIHGELACTGALERQPLTIYPHSEWRGLGQVMNREVHADPCWFEESK